MLKFTGKQSAGNCSIGQLFLERICQHGTPSLLLVTQGFFFIKFGLKIQRPMVSSIVRNVTCGNELSFKGKFFQMTPEFVLFHFLLFIFSQYTVEGSVKVTNVVFQSAINHIKIPQLHHYFCQRCSTMYCKVNNLLKLKPFLRKLGKRRKNKDSNFIS